MCSVQTEAKDWQIVDNAHYSYFNLEGDATVALQENTRVRLNGKLFKVLYYYIDIFVHILARDWG